MPRLPPLPEPEWDDELRPVLEASPPGFDVRLGDVNIFPTLARHPQLFRAWLPFGGFLLARGVLSPRERELLILRTGRNCGSDYEWGQHARIATGLGMAREEVLRVAEGPQAEGWSEPEAALLRAADELHADARISDATWSQLSGTHDEAALIEITMLVGHYHMVAFALNTLGVELDEGLEGLP
jgi:4-carboxymuconolactone decarboxylase